MSSHDRVAQIRRIEGNPPQFVGDELMQVADTYAEVFAGDPWYEVTRCTSSEREFRRTGAPGDICPSHATPLTAAYPRDEQMEVILGEVSHRDASMFVLEDGPRVVGFSWAYAYESPDDFIDAKYQGESSEAEQLRENVSRLLARHGLYGPFYYLSETGIIPDARYRGHGYSNELIHRRLEVADSLGLDVLQRTSCDSAMYNTAKTAGFQQINGRVSVRVPGGRNHLTNEYVGNFRDPINPDRVLFLKKQD